MLRAVLVIHNRVTGQAAGQPRQVKGNRVKKQVVITAAVKGLKTKFVSAVNVFRSKKDALVDVVTECRKAKVKRDTLIEWAIETGISKSYAWGIMAMAWPLPKEGGKNDRAQGRKASPKAAALLAYAVKQYGKEAPVVLLAAYRLSKKSSK